MDVPEADGYMIEGRFAKEKEIRMEEAGSQANAINDTEKITMEDEQTNLHKKGLLKPNDYVDVENMEDEKYFAALHRYIGTKPPFPSAVAELEEAWSVDDLVKRSCRVCPNCPNCSLHSPWEEEVDSEEDMEINSTEEIDTEDEETNPGKKGLLKPNDFTALARMDDEKYFAALRRYIEPLAPPSMEEEFDEAWSPDELVRRGWTVCFDCSSHPARVVKVAGQVLGYRTRATADNEGPIADLLNYVMDATVRDVCSAYDGLARPLHQDVQNALRGVISNRPDLFDEGSLCPFQYLRRVRYMLTWMLGTSLHYPSLIESWYLERPHSYKGLFRREITAPELMAFLERGLDFILPYFIVHFECSTEDRASQRVCTICMRSFEARRGYIRMHYCGHLFHPGCMKPELSKHNICPQCGEVAAQYRIAHPL